MRTVCLIVFAAMVSALAVGTAEPASNVKLEAGKTFSVQFPEMPPTFHAIFEQTNVEAMMMVCLPTNYDRGKKFPLLIFLNGWDGGDGASLGYARGLAQGRDFVCVSVPLFKAPGYQVSKANTPGANFIMVEEDGKYMWPFFKTMLEKVEELVPNIEPEHRVLGGFSQGAHATAALIDGSEGEATRLFSAFLMVEGGGRMSHFERLKDKAYLMVSSSAKSRPRAEQICEAAKAGGARTTFFCEDVGKHDFPASAYPKVRTWLFGAAIQ